MKKGIGFLVVILAMLLVVFNFRYISDLRSQNSRLFYNVDQISKEITALEKGRFTQELEALRLENANLRQQTAALSAQASQLAVEKETLLGELNSLRQEIAAKEKEKTQEKEKNQKPKKGKNKK